MSWGSALSAAGSIGSSLISANAAQKAADAQGDAADKSLAFYREIYNQNRADQAPYREAGYNALASMGNLLQDPSQITKTPGYDFRMGEGTKAIDRSAAARGLLGSGATGKALTRYGQDYATGEFNNTWNRLASLAGVGQTATQNTANSGNQAASGVGSSYLAGGQARASGYTGTANAVNNGIGNLLYLYGKN